MRDKANIIKYFRIVVAILYICYIIRMTLWNRSIYPCHIFYGLFWELKNQMWGDIIKNIALFVPFGFIVGGRKGIIISFLLSFGIETIQYFTRLGYCEVDDVMNNTIGAVLGTQLQFLSKHYYKDLIDNKRN